MRVYEVFAIFHSKLCYADNYVSQLSKLILPVPMTFVIQRKIYEDVLKNPYRAMEAHKSWKSTCYITSKFDIVKVIFYLIYFYINWIHLFTTNLQHLLKT